MAVESLNYRREESFKKSGEWRVESEEVSEATMVNIHHNRFINHLFTYSLIHLFTYSRRKKLHLP